MVKNLPAMQETQFDPWVRKIPLGEGNGNPLQYSCLGKKNPMNRALWATAHDLATERAHTVSYLGLIFRSRRKGCGSLAAL